MSGKKQSKETMVILSSRQCQDLGMGDIRYVVYLICAITVLYADEQKQLFHCRYR